MTTFCVGDEGTCSKVAVKDGRCIEHKIKKLSLQEALRPKTLDEIIGQDHLKTGIKNFIDQECQQWLFHGKTGTGKTSLAWIVARELQGFDYSVYDIREINGGRTSDVREILEKSDQRSCFNEGKYRVNIMDEAQELSDEARGLLLKPLEDQNSDYVWILCTMDVGKLHRALRDRCPASFQLKDMGQHERRQLVERAVKHLDYREDTAKFLKAIDQKELFSARDVLGAFERFANGIPAEEAVGS
jgi:replication-associated recombination protein RarA